ncbi:ATP-binding response regulator [Parvibacter caecicola]|uniref:Circadian input-output histidine kinase CikA n=1 Tax=Parvibacter caecicola TaxID=747645 RepID=A0A7W5D3D6_9ACTN|nr:ATP-binding protein [Parvibacter caecicola]MBB3171928.1 CheY-like chemotaxis protein [Parvibacter caecicola]MCR2041134.1 ATP-binding protein [Parvibacter caecicola]RNL11670.1 hypothetical protein DMP11_02700 [Parvibacter caecicola]
MGAGLHGNGEGSSADLARLSHDLRTPMNSITGFTRIALDHLDDPAKVQDCLQKILDSGQHMTALINDILDQGRLESGKVSMAHQPLSLRATAAWACDIVQVQAAEKALDFQVDLTGVDHDKVVGDGIRLRQVLQNLVSNAVKFTPPGGAVVLTVREEAFEGVERSWFVFEVADTGCGMSPEFMEVLFEPFSRETLPTTHSEEGTGLGMVIAKGLVELMDGAIAVDSRVGEGTTVTVRLPLQLSAGCQAAVAGDVVEMALTADESETCTPPVAGCHVLVADDDGLSRELLRELLGQYGVRITEAADGREALEKVLAADPHGFDAVLLDMHMPHLDGIAVARAIRDSAREDAATLPVIAVSADNFEEDCARALSHGVNAYVAKPFSSHQLISTLAQHVAR